MNEYETRIAEYERRVEMTPAKPLHNEPEVVDDQGKESES